MQGLLPVIGLLIACIIVMAVLKSILPGRIKGQVAHPYQKEPALFTSAERSFLGVLEQAVEGQFRVFGKIRLADVIKVKSGLSAGARQQAFNRIQSKHVDFVLCDLNDLSVQFVVELDDSSHQAPRRQNRDEFLARALEAAGVPLLRFPAKRIYSMHDVQGAISGSTPSPPAKYVRCPPNSSTDHQKCSGQLPNQS